MLECSSRRYSGEMARERKKTGQGAGGGPKTDAGKTRSSQNSTKHGLRSKALILPDETQEQFDEVERGWYEEFEPEGHAETTLVDVLVLNDWLRRRALRRAMEAEAAAVEACGAEPHAWSAEHRHTFELMQRYKTTAERAFYRSWTAVQGFRKDIMRCKHIDLATREKLARVEDELAEERKKRQELESLPGVKDIRKEQSRAQEREQSEAQKRPSERMFQGQLHPKKQRKISTLEQWVEVRIEDGQTVTRLYPSNEELIKRGQRMLPPPDLVYRRLHFPHGVPAEYAWCANDHTTRERGGMGIQRMEVDTWLEVIEREKAAGTGHVGPTGVGNLPRPMARGGCDCETCAANRALMEAAGMVW